jgi:Undecaprenyl-phosphate galactose phosphotransferase WbaP
MVCGFTLVTTDIAGLASSQALAAVIGAVLAHFKEPKPGFNPSHLHWIDLVSQQANVTIGLVVGVLIYLNAKNHYTEKLPFWTEARQLAATSLFALLTAGLIETSIHGNVSRQVLLGTWLFFPVIAIGLRQTVKSCLNQLGIWQVPILVVGDERAHNSVVDVLNSEAIPGYRIVQLLSTEMAKQISLEGWRDYLLRWGARRIAIAANMGLEGEMRVIESVVRQQIPFFIISQTSVLPVVGCEVVPFFGRDTAMLSYRNNLARPLPRLGKAILDLSVAGILLLVLAPVMLVIAFAIKCDGGPAIFSHKRIGTNGRTFKCLKFRSMVTDSDARLKEALANDPSMAEEWTANQKLRNDPRVTPIGRFLRTTSLDELPQLVNVLRLEMSLVGPRPIMMEEVARYDQDIAYYYETRPGMTGLWQVSGRSETSFAERVRLDTWYVKNWTIWHDLAILAKTVIVVAERRGAR